MSETKQPEYLAGSHEMGAETLRINGDVKIPDGEIVRSSLVVFGDLTAGANTRFLGSLYVQGNLRLGELTSVAESIHCEGNVLIGGQARIGGAIYCLGVLVIGKGVQAGLGEKGGGVVCKSDLYVEQEFTTGRKLEAKRVITVEKIDPELKAKLDDERPRPEYRLRQPPVMNETYAERQPTQVVWEKTQHSGNNSLGV